MFIGHFAVGFASKRVAPRTSVAVLIAATIFVDVLWPIFLLLGWERAHIEPGNTAFTPLAFDHYPITHSLAGNLGWAIVFALAYLAIARDRRGALVAGACVASHWVLDWVTHRPDLPLWPGDASRHGLGLWNSIAATFAVELAMLAAGVWTYTRVTRARDRIGTWALGSFVAFLLAAYFTSALGPPPPSVNVTAVTPLACLVLFAWIGWADRHRAVVARAV